MLKKILIVIMIVISPIFLLSNPNPNPNITIFGSIGVEYTNNDNFHEPLMSPYFYSGNIGIEIPPFKFLRIYGLYNQAYYTSKPVMVRLGQNEDGYYEIIDRYYDDEGKYIFKKSCIEFGIKSSINIHNFIIVKLGGGFIPIFSLVSETIEDGERRSGYDFKKNGYLGFSYIFEIEKQIFQRFRISLNTRYTNITSDYINLWGDYDGLCVNIGIGYNFIIKHF